MCQWLLGAVHDGYDLAGESRARKIQRHVLAISDKLAKPDLIIFDDIGMRKLSSTEAQDLCEILEERSIGKSVAFTTQLPLNHWAEVFADPVIADAIHDRLAHAALTVNITGESYRSVKARKLASGKKDA